GESSAPGVLRRVRPGAGARAVAPVRHRGGGVPAVGSGATVADRAVSHDLRSPLAAIKASVTDLLEADTAREPEAAREALESIDHEADRLSTLIANLLDMSRIESGMLSARPQGVEMTDVLVPCVDRIKAQWPGIEVALRLHPNA